MKTIQLWAVERDRDKPSASPVARVDNTETENSLEDLLVTSPELLMPDLTLIGRQVPTEVGALQAGTVTKGISVMRKTIAVAAIGILILGPSTLLAELDLVEVVVTQPDAPVQIYEYEASRRGDEFWQSTRYRNSTDRDIVAVEVG